MTQSTLRQVLTVFETAQRPLSLPQVAHDLNVSTERLEVMIQHWVRKGKIRERGSLTDCGSCGKNDSCAFVMEMPRTYELAGDAGFIPLSTLGSSCGYEPTKK